jgi:hypothetical protein
MHKYLLVLFAQQYLWKRKDNSEEKEGNVIKEMLNK